MRHNAAKKRRAAQHNSRLYTPSQCPVHTATVHTPRPAVHTAMTSGAIGAPALERPSAPAGQPPPSPPTPTPRPRNAAADQQRPTVSQLHIAPRHPSTTAWPTRKDGGHGHGLASTGVELLRQSPAGQACPRAPAVPQDQGRGAPRPRPGPESLCPCSCAHGGSADTSIGGCRQACRAPPQPARRHERKRQWPSSSRGNPAGERSPSGPAVPQRARGTPGGQRCPSGPAALGRG
jgi:hypothetical protein